MEIQSFNNLPKLLKVKDNYLLYARKSTESEDSQVASIDNQLEVLWKLAEEKGINILATFKESYSAKKPGRPAFNQMIDCVNTRNDIKGLLCWKLNRLSRNPQDSGVIRQILYDGRISEIVTFNKTYTEADSDFLMAIEDAQSQKFIRDLKEDTKRGIDKKLEMGWKPGLANVGYQNDMDKRQGERTISLHPVYGQLLRKIFALALSGKFSTRELYIKARQMGIKTARGQAISLTQMHYILRNPFYTGRFEYNGILYQGKHEPLLTDSEYNAIQKIIKGKSHTRKIKHTFALNGMITCGRSGHMFTGESKIKKSGKVFEYYKCSRKGHNCDEPMISAKELETQVYEFLKKIELKKAYVDWCCKWLRNAELQDRSVRVKQYQALKAEHTNLVNKIDNLTDHWVSVANKDRSLITDDEYRRLKQKYLIAKTDTYRRMKSLDQDLDQWTDTLIQVFNFTLDIQERWKSGTLQDKQHIIQVIGAKLIMKDRKLSVEARSPFRVIENYGSNQLAEAEQAQSDFDYSILGGLTSDARTILASNPQEYELLKSLLLIKYNTNYSYYDKTI